MCRLQEENPGKTDVNWWFSCRGDTFDPYRNPPVLQAWWQLANGQQCLYEPDEDPGGNGTTAAAINCVDVAGPKELWASVALNAAVYALKAGGGRDPDRPRVP